MLSIHGTPANFSDTDELECMVEESHLPAKTRVYADKEYTSQSNSAMLKKRCAGRGALPATALSGAWRPKVILTVALACVLG